MSWEDLLKDFGKDWKKRRLKLVKEIASAMNSFAEVADREVKIAEEWVRGDTHARLHTKQLIEDWKHRLNNMSKELKALDDMRDQRFYWDDDDGDWEEQ